MRYLGQSHSHVQKVEGLWGGRKGELFNEYRISVSQDERHSEDRWHNSVSILNTTELST